AARVSHHRRSGQFVGPRLHAHAPRWPARGRRAYPDHVADRARRPAHLADRGPGPLAYTAGRLGTRGSRRRDPGVAVRRRAAAAPAPRAPSGRRGMGWPPDPRERGVRCLRLRGVYRGRPAPVLGRASRSALALSLADLLVTGLRSRLSRGVSATMTISMST